MAKRNKLKVPKVIAGVRVPKRLRRAKKGIGQRELAAAALIAVAGALLSNKKVRKSLIEASQKAAKESGKVALKARDMTRGAIEAAERATDRIVASARVQAPRQIRRPRNTGASAGKH
jgi:hypothetical protein